MTFTSVPVLVTRNLGLKILETFCGLQFDNWLLGPERFSGLSRNWPLLSRQVPYFMIPVHNRVPLFPRLEMIQLQLAPHLTALKRKKEKKKTNKSPALTAGSLCLPAHVAALTAGSLIFHALVTGSIFSHHYCRFHVFPLLVQVPYACLPMSQPSLLVP